MKEISSRQNPEIIAVAALADAKERYKQQRFIAEGIRTCSSLINAKIKLVQLYVTHDMRTQGQQLASHFTLVSDHVMEKISQATTPSGIVGVFQMPTRPDADQLTSGLVMARISDPGNMGTLIRTCAALNIQSIVIVEGADPWSAKVVQASAGTIGSVKIFQWKWNELLENKKEFDLCALVVSGGKSPDQIIGKNILFVVGNEAEGIPSDWIASCNETMTLPIASSVESLNAAVAGSLALYLYKQQA